MDPSVIEAMARWPNVPAVYGWLSLDPRGRWNLHPGGTALQGTPGERITSPQIIRFIGRNYGQTRQGRWYFQNGPQRVFVRLDAAPFILRLDAEARGLQTHTNLPVRQIQDWWLDDDGHLYLRTEHGPGRLEDRDLAAVLEQMQITLGPTLDTLLDQPPAAGPCAQARLSDGPPAPLYRIAAGQVPARLGFIPFPAPDKPAA